MHDYLLIGIAAIGTLILAGGGAWISKVFFHKNTPPKA